MDASRADGAAIRRMAQESHDLVDRVEEKRADMPDDPGTKHIIVAVDYETLEPVETFAHKTAHHRSDEKVLV